MAKFRKIPHVIEATRLANSGTMETPQGRILYEAGQWLVTGIDGEQYIIPHDRFKKLYQPADEAAAAYYEEVT